MDGPGDVFPLLIGQSALDRLMPMHVRLAPNGVIAAAGPTVRKVAGPIVGRPFFEVFQIRRPAGIGDMRALCATSGERIRLALAAPPCTALRGFAVPVGADGGAIVKLSFGIGLADAVRDHGLTDSDFAPTDLAVEMLYLIEAKGLVADELTRLTERLQGARDAAERQAMTDTLTGLFNRRALEASLDRLIAARRPFALMHIDLDRFKEVNDTLGHAAGDHVLTEAARIMLAGTRGGDTVARIGGDEFVILLPGLTDAGAVERIAERIIARLELPITFGEHTCRISASAGIVMSTAYADPEADRLLSDADRALYASKHGGRGRATLG